MHKTSFNWFGCHCKQDNILGFEEETAKKQAWLPNDLEECRLQSGIVLAQREGGHTTTGIDVGWLVR